MTEPNSAAVSRSVAMAFNDAAPPVQRAAAHEFCMQLRSSPRGWELCLELLQTSVGSETPAQIPFWYLEVVTNAIAKLWNELSDVDRLAIRAGLMIFVRDVVVQCSFTPYVKNKLAEAFRLLVREDYPNRWPSFFRDWLSLLQKSAQLVDVFLRIITLIGEDLRDNVASRATLNTNMIIKDEMRRGDIDLIINVLVDVVVACVDHAPDLVASSMECVSLYICWMDIRLVANEKFISITYSLLQRSMFRVVACKCILEIVYKNMDPELKVQLIRDLNVGPLVRGLLESGLDKDEEFGPMLVSLITTIGQTLLSVLEGISQDTESAQATSELLAGLLDVEIRLLQGADEDSGCNIALFLSNFFRYVRQHQSASLSSRIQSLLTVLLKRLQYPETYRFGVNDDAECDFDRFRGRLILVFQGIVRLAPQFALGWVAQGLTQAQSNADKVSPLELEALLHLACQSAGDKGYVKESSASLPSLYGLDGAIASVIQDPAIRSCPHRAVHIALLEIAFRYVRLLDEQVLTCVLSLFLEAGHGIAHADNAVRERAAYLLVRLVKRIMSFAPTALVPVVDEVISAIHRTILNLPTSTEHCLDYSPLCEALGVLVARGTGTVATNEIIATLDRASGPLCASIQAKSNKPWTEETAGELSVIINGLASLWKAVGPWSSGAHTGVSQQTRDVLETIVRVVESQNCVHKDLRNAAIMFVRSLHSIADVTQSISRFISCLLMNSNEQPEGVIDVCSLLSHLIVKHKTDAFSLLEFTIFGVADAVEFILASFARIDQVNVASASSGPRQQRAEVLRIYFQLWHNALRLGGIERLQVHAVTPVFEYTMRLLAHVSVSLSDSSCRKFALEVLRGVIERAPYLDSSLVAAYKQFMLSEFVQLVIVAPTGFSETDASQMASLQCLSKLLIALAQTWPEEMSTSLLHIVQGPFGVGNEVLSSLGAAAQCGDGKSLQEVLRMMYSRGAKT